MLARGIVRTGDSARAKARKHEISSSCNYSQVVAQPLDHVCVATLRRNVRGKTPSMRMQPTAFSDERAMAEGRNPAVRAPRGPPDETSGGSPEGKPFDVFGGITKLFGANQHDVKLAL